MAAPSRHIRRQLMLGSAGAATLAFAARPQAAELSPLHLVLGFAVGGGADIIARIASTEIAAIANRNVLVENRAGAGGRIAINVIKAAPADGSRLFFGSTSVLTLFPYVFDKLPYSLEEDFTPVSTLCAFAYAIVVSPTIGVRTLAELLDWARRHPDRATFGTPGIGTPQHLIGTLLGKLGGAPFTHVPFKSGSEANQQLLGGQIPMIIATTGQFIEMHHTGRIRIIATTDDVRSRIIPDVPTCAESGFPKLVFKDSFGFIGPAGLAAPIVADLSGQIAAATRSDKLRQGLDRQALDPLLIHGQAYEHYLKLEKQRWQETVRTIGFSPMSG
ncbi:MAG: Bug family tripartite tricarboxylate transporter substrate binding protein [Lautropia sp.]